MHFLFTPAELRMRMNSPDATRHVVFGGASDVGVSCVAPLGSCFISCVGFYESQLGGRDWSPCRRSPLPGVPRTYFYPRPPPATTERPCATPKSDCAGVLTGTSPEARDGVLMHVSEVHGCPPHTDYARFRNDLVWADGLVLVIDCVEGVCVQTETVLRQALTERICPVVFINKVDRAILELQLDPEEAYQGFVKTLQKVNVVIATYNDPSMGDVQVSPEKGTVAIGSGLQRWALSLTRFAKMYASKFGVDEMKMRERLWGDNFFDAKNKKWIKQETNSDGERVRRAFCQFCMDPIYQIFDAIMNEKKDKIDKMLKSLNVQLTADEREQVPKKLLKTVMMKFLPAAETLLQMIVSHLPSPKKAQSYRAEMLYSGEPSADDKYFMGIKNCDPNAPLMLYISKMVPTPDRGRFFAFGRIFAGKVASGQKVRIMGNNYVYGKKQDMYDDKPVQRAVLMMGSFEENIGDMPCGHVVGLVGVDTYIVKSATITDDGESPHPFRDMKYSVSPVVRVTVEATNPPDLPKLVEGLKRLAKFDPLVVCSIEETGEHIVAGAGELHLEICLKDLQDDFMNGAPLKISEPVVSFRETVTEVSSQLCAATSANTHNRLCCRGAPLTEALSLAIEEGAAAAADADPETRTRYLAESFEWDVQEARQIWCYGPDKRGPNVVVDVTKDVQKMGELKDSIVAAWQWATREGVLCAENMRGVRLNLEDVTMHADATHRGGGQIIPTARRVFSACCLTASPRLMEPIFLVDIHTTGPALTCAYDILSRRRGDIIGGGTRPGIPLYNVKAYLPVTESLGFTNELATATDGHALAHCVFDHWELCESDPLDSSSPAHAVVRRRRVHQGLPEAIPTVPELLKGRLT